jgi:glycosyltransferase involved in cell wall biosynthesis
VSPFVSRGVFRRAYNIAEVAFRQGDVNHVTGDVHFLNFGLARQRTILTIHDCGNLHRLRGLRSALLKTLWFDWPIAQCRIVTTISDTTRREVLALTRCPESKIRVIPNCVSPDFIPCSKSFNHACPCILLVGTTANKNLERVAAALAGVSCNVELIGSPTELQVAEFARHSVRLRVLGPLDRAGVVDAYRRCDVVLFASLYEGFGLPILEAQATARAVITSNIAPMVEVAGGGASLVDPGVPESIRHGLLRVTADEGYRSACIAQGLENVRRYSATAIAGAYAQLYREVARDAIADN